MKRIVKRENHIMTVPSINKCKAAHERKKAEGANLQKLLFIAVFVFIVVIIGCDLNRDKRNYELQERCGKRAEEVCKNEFPASACKNHYNKRLNKCIIHTTHISTEGHTEGLDDANEKKEFGAATFWFDGKFIGRIQGKPCKDRQEWDTFVKKMMED